MNLADILKRFHYPFSRIQVEYGVNFGREVKRADIVVMDKDRRVKLCQQ